MSFYVLDCYQVVMMTMMTQNRTASLLVRESLIILKMIALLSMNGHSRMIIHLYFIAQKVVKAMMVMNVQTRGRGRSGMVSFMQPTPRLPILMMMKSV